MRIGLALVLLLGCGASTGTVDPPSDAAAPAPSGCLPACMARMFAACSPPVGACTAYITAAPDNWRRCFDNGLVVEAQPMGAHRFRQGRAVCAAVTSLGAATVTVDTWRGGDGRVVATVTRGPAGGAWRVDCDGAEHAVDPSSAACQADPWVRNANPHALSCPIDTEACRER